jgi:hypothetical protein
MTAHELLKADDALLTRTHLRELGLNRRAIDAVFRSCPAVSLEGYGRTMVRVGDYRRLIADRTFDGDRVRPAA